MRKVASAGRLANSLNRWASFSATVLPVSSRYTRIAAGIITSVTSDDSQSNGNWYAFPAKTDPNGITWE